MQNTFSERLRLLRAVRAGILSTFGAAGESRRSVPFIVLFEWSAICRQFGWQRGVPSSHSVRTVGEGLFYFIKS